MAWSWTLLATTLALHAPHQILQTARLVTKHRLWISSKEALVSVSVQQDFSITQSWLHQVVKNVALHVWIVMLPQRTVHLVDFQDFSIYSIISVRILAQVDMSPIILTTNARNAVLLATLVNSLHQLAHLVLTLQDFRSCTSLSAWRYVQPS